MNRIAISYIPRRSFMQAAVSLCMFVLLLTTMPCRSAIAQEPDKPEAMPPKYLSTITPLPGSHVTTSTANILSKPYRQSISFDCNTFGVTEVRYNIPDGYKRFRTAIGIDDKFSNERVEFDFTLIGKDADGKERDLITPKTLQAGSKPVDINVDIKGIKLLILKQKLNGGGNYDTGEGVAWWTEARLLPFDDTPKPPTLLIFDDKQVQEQLQKLAQVLTKDLDGKSFALTHFVLMGEPNEQIAEQNALDIQESLKQQLSQTKVSDTTSSKEPISTLKPGWEPGEELDDNTRAALRTNFDAKYIVIGLIRDREKQAVVSAAVYERLTGKYVVDDKERIDIKERRVLKPPVDPKKPDDPKQPPVDGPQVSLIFRPNPKLQITSYEWFLDGISQGTKSISQERPGRSISVDIVPGKHKLKMVWSGNGFNGRYTTASIDEFEADLQTSNTIEIRADATADTKVGPVTVKGKLVLYALIGKNKISLTWQ